MKLWVKSGAGESLPVHKWNYLYLNWVRPPYLQWWNSIIQKCYLYFFPLQPQLFHPNHNPMSFFLVSGCGHSDAFGQQAVGTESRWLHLCSPLPIPWYFERLPLYPEDYWILQRLRHLIRGGKKFLGVPCLLNFHWYSVFILCSFPFLPTTVNTLCMILVCPLRRILDRF